MTMVPLNCEATLQNIKEACKKYFQLTDMECDLLAGERGPSFTEISQIKIWKVLHIRFLEPGVRFSKLPVITGPVKLFCFPFQMRVSQL